MPEILVVDDDDALRSSLAAVLRHEGHAVTTAASVDDALAALRRVPTDLVLSDFKMRGKHGIDFLTALRAVDAAVPFVLMTGYGTVDLAVEAMKRGADDVVLKPFPPEHILQRLSDLTKGSREGACSLRPAHRPVSTLISHNERVKQVLDDAARVARVDSPVLIVGESGTGKEILARTIHFQGPRREKPFIPINCGALPDSLVEEELFGHEVGAFTGASAPRLGLFESAAGGTLFLDEVGELPHPVQVKLLRVLQEGTFRRLGGSEERASDVRIICATNRNLEKAMEEGTFRADLFYRLAVVTLTLPPLRERRDDILTIAEHLLSSLRYELEQPGLRLSLASEELLLSYPFPGNVRELENALERGAIAAQGASIEPHYLGLVGSESDGLREIGARAAAVAEERAIRDVLRAVGGNRTKAAKILQVSTKTLAAKLKSYATSVS